MAHTYKPRAVRLYEDNILPVNSTMSQRQNQDWHSRPSPTITSRTFGGNLWRETSLANHRPSLTFRHQTADGASVPLVLTIVYTRWRISYIGVAILCLHTVVRRDRRDMVYRVADYELVRTRY